MDSDSSTATPYSSTDPIHAADAFMRRMRPIAEDDIPLLDEVVAPTNSHPLTLGKLDLLDLPSLELPVLDGIETSVSTPEAHLDEEMISAVLDAHMERWLEKTLPRLVFQIVESMSDKLIEELNSSARTELLPQLKKSFFDQNRKPTIRAD